MDEEEEISKIINRIDVADSTIEPSSPDIEAQQKLIELDGRKSFFALRTTWSCCIIVWISIIILFHIVLTILVGCNILNFEAKPWFPVTIIFENLLQIIGMGYIVIKFLYPAHDK